MSDPMIIALAGLLKESLTAWQLDGYVSTINDGINVSAEDKSLLIARAPAGMPFRWVVTVADRRRTAASVNGVLRIVPQTIAPGYEPLSLRIAPLPVRPEQGAS